MNPALMSTAEVLRKLSISETTLWRLERGGEFPKPIKIGKRVKRWRSEDVEAYIAKSQVQ